MTALPKPAAYGPDACVQAKGILDGATTLAEAALMARAFADELQCRHDEGYTLRWPVADDHVYYRVPPLSVRLY